MVTSYCDLLVELHQRLLNGGFKDVQTVSKGDKSVTYSSQAELERQIHFVEMMCNKERGLHVRRTYARNAGRG